MGETIVLGAPPRALLGGSPGGRECLRVVHLVSMPTVLRSGPYRLFSYSSDRSEPPHVHVERESNRANFWLDPVRLFDSGGFGRTEINQLRALVVGKESVLLEAWHEFFGS